MNGLRWKRRLARHFRALAFAFAGAWLTLFVVGMLYDELKASIQDSLLAVQFIAITCFGLADWLRGRRRPPRDHDPLPRSAKVALVLTIGLTVAVAPMLIGSVGYVVPAVIVALTAVAAVIVWLFSPPPVADLLEARFGPGHSPRAGT